MELCLVALPRIKFNILIVLTVVIALTTAEALQRRSADIETSSVSAANNSLLAFGPWVHGLFVYGFGLSTCL